MQSFDDLAPDYHRMAELVPPPFAGWLEGQLPVHGTRALDAGCGSGNFAQLLARRFDHVIGLDISASMIEIALGRRLGPNIEFRQQDLMLLQDEAGFDFVLSCCVLHHLHDLEAALWHLRGLVRARGSAVLIDNVAWTATPPRWVYVLSALRQLQLDVKAHGWRDARWLFRFRTNHRWLDHLATDRYLLRKDFRHRYGAVFPGAGFRSFGWAEGLIWQAP